MRLEGAHVAAPVQQLPGCRHKGLRGAQLLANDLKGEREGGRERGRGGGGEYGLVLFVCMYMYKVYL